MKITKGPKINNPDKVVELDKIKVSKNELVLKFKVGVLELHNKLLKKQYKIIKDKLYELNEILDQYDSSEKNAFDKEKYESLSDLEQTYYLIEDIFDNYGMSNGEFVYSEEEVKMINQTLLDIDKRVNLEWFNSLINDIK